MATTKAKDRRISFGEFDAAHLYSLALENFCVSGKEGVCAACVQLKQRLEKMIGPKEIQSIQRQAKKHPK
jgi:hypothetical protein